jgi:hypothetical protein
MRAGMVHDTVNSCRDLVDYGSGTKKMRERGRGGKGEERGKSVVCGEVQVRCEVRVGVSFIRPR